jgi:hypothetical protein
MVDCIDSSEDTLHVGLRVRGEHIRMASGA